ncbi:hypothetical protein ACFQS2_08810 [Brachybacterium sp. GCM10030267]|uniref:hypothetical protein n=1 Tax=unclassified Brachybacterium TaxID=2623841 RepID=UPI00360A16E7
MRKQAIYFGVLAAVGAIAILWLLLWRPTVTYSHLYDRQPCFAVLEPVEDAYLLPREPHNASDPTEWSGGDQERLHRACERVRTRNTAISALLITPTLLLGQAAWRGRSSREPESSSDSE